MLYLIRTALNIQAVLNDDPLFWNAYIYTFVVVVIFTKHDVFIEVVHPDDESVACVAFDSSYDALVSPMAMPLNPDVELEKFALAMRM